MNNTPASAWIPRGELNTQTALEILAQGQKEIDNISQELIIDLTHIHSVDSAGLAVLLEWVKYAFKRNKKIQLRHLPIKLQHMISLSNLQDILKASPV